MGAASPDSVNHVNHFSHNRAESEAIGFPFRAFLQKEFMEHGNGSSVEKLCPQKFISAFCDVPLAVNARSALMHPRIQTKPRGEFLSVWETMNIANF